MENDDLKKSGNNLGVIIVTVVITLMAAVIVYLLFIKSDDNGKPVSNNTDNNQPTNNPTTKPENNSQKEIQKKFIVNNKDNCSNSTEIFNGITITIKQEKNENDFCYASKLLINGHDYDFLYDENMIDFYEFFDKNVIMSVSTESSGNIIIYDINKKSMVFNGNDEIPNVFLESWSIENNKIIFEGNVCSYEQCGQALYDKSGKIANSSEKSENLPRLKYEIEYNNGVFSKPKMVGNTYYWK